MNQMYTVGYQGESLETFTAKLLKNSIYTVIDVRENPISRKPGFSKKKLANALNTLGITYHHFHELGTPAPLRDYLKETSNYPIFFKRYREFLPEFQESLNDIIEIGQEKNLCIMCFEKDHNMCHRNVIAEMLTECLGKMVKIIHI